MKTLYFKYDESNSAHKLAVKEIVSLVNGLGIGVVLEGGEWGTIHENNETLRAHNRALGHALTAVKDALNLHHNLDRDKNEM